MNASIRKNNLREMVVSIAKRMNNLGINQGCSGNVSMRIPKGMLITPSSINYEIMQAKDVVALDLNGKKQLDQHQQETSKSIQPSSEWQLHAEILKKRPEINSVLHCHPIHATALACHRKGIPSFHYMTAIAGGHDIPCTSYSTFGTSELALKALKALKNRSACLLANHGLVTIATNLETALNIALEVETLANIYLKACQLGEPNHLNKKEMKRVLDEFKRLNYSNNTKSVNQ